MTHILSKLGSLKMRLKDLAPDETDGAEQAAQKHMAIPASLQKQAAQARNVGKKSSAGDNSGNTPTKYNTLRACSVKFLSEQICEAIEPSTLSAPNTRRMLTRGKAEANKEQMQRIVEMGTSMPPDMVISSSMSELASFKSYARSRYLSRGRRCRDLPLPPVWGRDGWFRIEGLSDAGATIRHKFLEKTALVPLDKLPRHHSLANLYMEYNWSETRAAVASTMDPNLDEACCVQYLFPNQITNPEFLQALSEPMFALEAGSAPHLAITDGDDDTNMPPPSLKRPNKLQDEDFVTPKHIKKDGSVETAVKDGAADLELHELADAGAGLARASGGSNSSRSNASAPASSSGAPAAKRAQPEEVDEGSVIPPAPESEESTS